MHHRTMFCSEPSRNRPAQFSVSKLPVALCALLLASAFLAWAQGAGRTLLGTVTDPSGAVVPNVAITVTNTGTNQASHFTTNQSGEFVAPDLPIGHYVIVAEVAGFKKSEQKDIKLDVGARTRVDIKLEIGSTQESVTVEANAVALQTESGEISDVITGQQVSQLATNGRSIYSLATLTAGASSNMVDFKILHL